MIGTVQTLISRFLQRRNKLMLREPAYLQTLISKCRVDRWGCKNRFQVKIQKGRTGNQADSEAAKKDDVESWKGEGGKGKWGIKASVGARTPAPDVTLVPHRRDFCPNSMLCPSTTVRSLQTYNVSLQYLSHHAYSRQLTFTHSQSLSHVPILPYKEAFPLLFWHYSSFIFDALRQNELSKFNGNSSKR